MQVTRLFLNFTGVGTRATIAPRTPTSRQMKLRGPGNQDTADLPMETQEKSKYPCGCVENLVGIYECEWLHHCKTYDAEKRLQR